MDTNRWLPGRLFLYQGGGPGYNDFYVVLFL